MTIWLLLGVGLIFRPFEDEVILYAIINVIGWGTVAHQIIFTCRELCEIEDIYVFTIKHKKKLTIPNGKNGKQKKQSPKKNGSNKKKEYPSPKKEKNN